MQNEFIVKVIPPEGLSVYRLRFRRRHIALAAFGFVALLVAVVGAHIFQLQRAEADVRALQAVTAQQKKQLDDVAGEAQTIANRLHAMEQHDEELRRSMGLSGKPHPKAAPPKAEAHASASLPAVLTELRILARASSTDAEEQGRLRASVVRVLNLRRLRATLRTAMLAAIPSINPAGDVAIRSGFGWRSSPFPEFHRGLDLAADYGDAVHAAAAGTVVSAGWDGGFGIKVDIDHGNGYHTWYAHLSRTAVVPGEHVGKGQLIANVGSTGESTGAHLHYQIMREGEPIDPTPFLAGVPKTVAATLPAATE